MSIWCEEVNVINIFLLLFIFIFIIYFATNLNDYQQRFYITYQYPSHLSFLPPSTARILFIFLFYFLYFFLYS